MNVITRKCSVQNLLDEPNFQEVLDRYADELAVEGLPHPSAKIEIYRQLESLGKLQPIAAYFNDFLIGFVNVLMSENPHYGVCIGVTESYFVLKDYRKTGAGTLLRREAELCSQASKSPGLFISAPSGSNLALALEACKDYTETVRVFFKRFDYA